MNSKPFLYFASQRAIGSAVSRYFQEFLQVERMKPEQLRELQDRRLEELLRHAVGGVPFYRERVASQRPALLDFPILTKADVRTNLSDLMTDGLRLEYTGVKRKPAYSWIAVKTGGSTGVPTTVIHDREYRDRGRAGRLYSRVLCGFPLGTPYFRLWGSMQEINQARTSWKERIQSYLANEIWLNAFRMEEQDMVRHLSTMRSSSAINMMAYVDVAVELAKFAHARKLHPKPLRSIMACAGTVTPEARSILQNVFQACVHNQYGSRDCAGIACECDQGGLHIYSNNLVIEVVDDVGDAVPTGHAGRVLVTLLGNHSFPVIRYEIGDVAALATGQCRCGRPFPLLSKVEGRTIEFLRSTEGAYVSPVYIRHLIGVVHNPGLIRRFQLVQHSAWQFSLNLETESACTEESCRTTLKLFERDLQAVLGPGAEIRTSLVPTIPLSPSGKFLYTINEYSRANADSVQSYTA